jgi:hypothetical protein
MRNCIFYQAGFYTYPLQFSRKLIFSLIFLNSPILNQPGQDSKQESLYRTAGTGHLGQASGTKQLGQDDENMTLKRGHLGQKS